MMTREETIEELERLLSHWDELENGKRSFRWYSKAALEVALSALRPVSREQVEKVWSGCDFCNRADFGEFGFEITKHYAKICCALGNWRFPEKEQFLFCPKCGKPLTDEAVEMVLERMALKDGKGD